MSSRKKANILQLIRDSYDKFNDTNRKISDFILNNLELATFASLNEISKKVGVSDATLVRFARELGYNGFRELREDLVSYIRQIIYPAQKASLLQGHDKHPLIDLVTSKDIEYITKTMMGIHKQDFDKLIEFILNARTIFCMG